MTVERKFNGTRVIGVDARTLSDPGSVSRGIGHYTVYHLEALAREQPDWMFLLFVEDPEARTWALDRLSALPNTEMRAMRDLSHTRIDLLHVPDLMGLPRKQRAPWEHLPPGIPYSVVFYDLIPLVLRDEFIDRWLPEERNNYLRRIGSLKHSKALILTISKHTKEDLVRYAAIGESRIVPIMAGLNHSAGDSHPDQDRIQAVLDAQGLDHPFFLVVGALDRHKRFHTTLAAFAELLKFHAVQLVVVGSLSNPVTAAFKHHIEKQGLDAIQFAGFLEREDLECLYRAARALVFPSAYEGFGFPVLEAMSLGCPVITSNASSLPEVAGDAALLVSPDDPEEVWTAMRRLLEEPHLREMLINRGQRQATRFSWQANACATLDAWLPLLGLSIPTEQPQEDQQTTEAPSTLPTVCWEGSQFVWHSLAHVNRQLCLGLLGENSFNLTLAPYERDQFHPKDHPGFEPLAPLINRRLPGSIAVHIRHQWPPNFTPPRSGCWVMVQPWEFGGIPQAWIRPMTESVDEIWVYTTCVRDRYIESGVPADKVVVISLGVNTIQFQSDGPRYPLKSKQPFRFLYVGGIIHRKGFDVLLRAYRKAFTANDEVCLVIKAQGGGVYRGSELHEQLEALRQDPLAPEVEFLQQDLSEADLSALYRSCHAFVMPYRGEGFGLPIAEAMASGLPVIVTGRGAAMDFTQGDWAYRIPSQRMPTPRVDELLPGPAGFWLEEPDEDALAECMSWVAAHPEEARIKGSLARAFAEANLGWEGPIQKITERIHSLALRQPLRFKVEPPPTPGPVATALLYAANWAQSDWVEVIVSYLMAFSPGEPVALILPLPGGESTISPSEAEQRVLAVAQKMNRTAFPDIVILGTEDDLSATLKPYLIQEVIPLGRGAVTGLCSLAGLRFANARKLLS